MKAPQLQITAGSVLIVGAVLAVLGVVLWNRKAIAQTAAAAAEKVNPASPNNIAYSGVSAVGATLTGAPDWTLGGWLAELMDPNTRKVNDLYGPGQGWKTQPGGLARPDVQLWPSEAVRGAPIFEVVPEPYGPADGVGWAEWQP